MFEQIVRRFEQEGYPDTKLQGALIQHGNAAAAENFPKLDRIVDAELLPAVDGDAAAPPAPPPVRGRGQLL